MNQIKTENKNKKKKNRFELFFLLKCGATELFWHQSLNPLVDALFLTDRRVSPHLFSWCSNWFDLIMLAKARKLKYGVRDTFFFFF